MPIRGLSCAGCETYLVLNGQYYQGAVDLISVNKRLLEIKKSLDEIDGTEIPTGTQIEVPLTIHSFRLGEASRKVEDTITLEVQAFQRQNQIRQSHTKWCSGNTILDVEADRPVLHALASKSFAIDGHPITITYSLKIYLEEHTQEGSTYGC